MSSNSGSKPDENRRRILKLAGAGIIGGGILYSEEIRELLAGGGKDGKEETPTPSDRHTSTETRTETAIPTATELPYDVEAGKTYSWHEFEQCLSQEQEENIEAQLGEPRKFRYQPQIDGDLYDVNIIRDGKTVAYLDNEDLDCNVRE